MFSPYKIEFNTLEEAFKKQEDFIKFRNFNKFLEPFKLERSFYSPLGWLPGRRPMPDYFKYLNRLRRVNKYAYIDYHVFNNIYPAALYFSKSCHIKYQYNMYREMNEDFLSNNPHPWRSPLLDIIKIKRPY